MDIENEIEKYKKLLKENEAEVIRLMKEQDPYNGKYEQKFISFKKAEDIMDSEETIKNCKKYITKLEILKKSKE